MTSWLRLRLIWWLLAKPCANCGRVMWFRTGKDRYICCSENCWHEFLRPKVTRD